MKQALRLVLLVAGAFVAWWLLVRFVLPLLGIALGLLWVVVKVGLAVLLVVWAYQIFKRWNGPTPS